MEEGVHVDANNTSISTPVTLSQHAVADEEGDIDEVLLRGSFSTPAGNDQSLQHSLTSRSVITGNGDAEKNTTSPSDINTPSERSPDTVKKALTFSPTTPTIGGRKSMSPGRDYKQMYYDVKRKALEYSLRTDARLAKYRANYDRLLEKCDRELNNSKMHHSERETILTTENNKLKEMIDKLQPCIN